MPESLYEPESLGWTFPITIRGDSASHGYDTGCPQLATDSGKAVGTVSIVKQSTNEAGAEVWVPAVDENESEITDLPMTALVDEGTSLEFTLYQKITAEGTYQMRATILIPDPNNDDFTIEFRLSETFRIKDKWA